MFSFSRKQIAWAFYDWANSAFATTVMAGFFPLFFKRFWASELSPTESTFQLGLASSGASLLVAIFSPILGAVSDAGGKNNRLLLFFTVCGALATATLWRVPAGAWNSASVLYIIASIGFSGGCLFYDSLLVQVAPDNARHRVSALGYSLGYLGGGILFAFNIFMTQKPALFGLNSVSDAVQVSFLMVGVWWLLFSIPLFSILQKTPITQLSWVVATRTGFSELSKTLKSIRRLPMAVLFLFAFWLYMDGVDTVIKMAIDYGLSVGLSSNDLVKALLLTQFVGFPSALIFGSLGEKWGAKKSIFLAIAVYVGVVFLAYTMETATQFYAAAISIGLVQGGIQALSRSLYTKLIPSNHSAEFFGFFNMMGKCAAILGPVLMGVVAKLSGNSRISIFVLLFLFGTGAIFLSFVDEKRGSLDAANW